MADSLFLYNFRRTFIHSIQAVYETRIKKNRLRSYTAWEVTREGEEGEESGRKYQYLSQSFPRYTFKYFSRTEPPHTFMYNELRS